MKENIYIWFPIPAISSPRFPAQPMSTVCCRASLPFKKIITKITFIRILIVQEGFDF